MLKQRIITALILLAVLLPAIFYPRSEAFGLVALLLISASAWEWARLNQTSPTLSLVSALGCGCICVASWMCGLLSSNLQVLWILAGSGWVVLGFWLLRGGAIAWLALPRLLRLGGGFCVLWVAWLAAVQVRMQGINFLFSVLFLVWVADVFAYFSGRTLGGRFFRRKLAPTISPGKTWEGVVGGMLAVVALAFAWRWFDGHAELSQASLYTRLGNIHMAFMLFSVLFLTTMSVVGDLVESLIKRSAGVKDSSALLPGHGGVLDRVDALLPILPLVMMLCTL